MAVLICILNTCIFAQAINSLKTAAKLLNRLIQKHNLGYTWVSYFRFYVFLDIVLRLIFACKLTRVVNGNHTRMNTDFMRCPSII